MPFVEETEHASMTEYLFYLETVDSILDWWVPIYISVKRYLKKVKAFFYYEANHITYEDRYKSI